MALSRSVLTVAGLALLAAGGVYWMKDYAPSANATATDQVNSPVVLQLGDKSYTEAAVNAEITNSLPEGANNGEAVNFGDLDPAVQKNVLQGLVRRELLMQEAKSSDIEKDAKLQQKLAMLHDRLVLDAYLDKKLDELVPAAAIEAEYKTITSQMGGQEEVKARHILVESEAEAKKIAEELKKGGDFAKLAAEHSKDPGSKQSGGDLGYFTKDKMVKEFAEAAFALKNGEVSAPVKSDFGWHIIKTEDRRAVQPPALAEVRDQLRNKLAPAALEKYLQAKLDGQKVEFRSADGKMAPLFSADAPAQPATAAAAPADAPKAAN
jgi:peptidyl-prolyl cis-trans isomerase C